MLEGKKIILAICGSIAAYKAALITRLLVKAGAEVQVLMTPAATSFITPLTLATLSKRPVLTQFQKDEEGTWNNHVDLGKWADALVIAPATSLTLAKCAQAQCDNLLIATYLSATCPVFFAPAMDLDMYQHPANKANIERLKSFSNLIIPSEYGELASGLVGEGRMAEPEAILAFLSQKLGPKLVLKGKKVLINAGPTQEALDPVRYISNHSSGKMGYALAEIAAEWGAEVELVSGPTHLSPIAPSIHLHPVLSAQEMYEAMRTHFQEADIIILAAAVADYTPIEVSSEKIKKKPHQNEMSIHLKRTVDIAASLGKVKLAHQKMIGFALETQNERENAQRKLEKKNLDLIVLNSLRTPGAGFAHDTNQVSILGPKGLKREVGLKSKREVAQEIWEEVLKLPIRT